MTTMSAPGGGGGGGGIGQSGVLLLCPKKQVQTVLNKALHKSSRNIYYMLNTVLCHSIHYLRKFN